MKRRLIRLALTEVGAGKLAATLLVSLVAMSLLLTAGFRSATGLVDRLDRERERQLVANYIARQTDLSTGQQAAAGLVDAAFLERLGTELVLQDVALAARAPQDAQRNALALRAGDGRVLGWLEWRSPPRSTMMRDRIRPLFAAYVIFLVAVLLGAASVIKMLRTAMARLRLREAQAVHEARHDEMTGLPNRAHFIERLDQQLKALARRRHGQLALAFLDLDHFKYINDTLGHSAGDALVCQVAARARRLLPPSDLIARIGGDEFVVLRGDSPGQGTLHQLGSDLMALFEAPFTIDGRTIDVTASCGISWAPELGQVAEDLLRKADIALFRAKQRGRGRWRAFTREMEDTVHRRRLLETELRKALQHGGLTLAYQPIVAADSERIEEVEALLRWHHPELGALSPALFVPVAEQAGLMPLLGWWTLGRVFEQRRAWPQLNLSINLSPLQLAARGFLVDLAALVEQFAVDPHGITFEVTEGVLMERGTLVFDVLEALKEMGFGIALDDFGTGYSSLSYLRAFAFDRIKIDRSFVQHIENDSNAHAILKAIVALGQSLEIRTVAEGVETPLQRDLVRAAGCDLIQGFLYYQPMTGEDLVRLLAALPGEAGRGRRRGPRAA